MYTHLHTHTHTHMHTHTHVHTHTYYTHTHTHVHTHTRTYTTAQLTLDTHLHFTEADIGAKLPTMNSFGLLGHISTAYYCNTLQHNSSTYTKAQLTNNMTG